jgi:hypothetical protein
MRKILIPLSIAALTFAAIGAGAVQAPLQVAEQTFEFPTNDRENDVHFRDIADLTIRHD